MIEVVEDEIAMFVFFVQIIQTLSKSVKRNKKKIPNLSVEKQITTILHRQPRLEWNTNQVPLSS